MATKESSDAEIPAFQKIPKLFGSSSAICWTSILMSMIIYWNHATSWEYKREVSFYVDSAPTLRAVESYTSFRNLKLSTNLIENWILYKLHLVSIHCWRSRNLKANLRRRAARNRGELVCATPKGWSMIKILIILRAVRFWWTHVIMMANCSGYQIGRILN